jgi:phosphohistidine phosphatase SixA
VRGRARAAAVVLLLLAAPPALAQPPGAVVAIDAARRGGVVLACRHAMTDQFDENEATLRYDDAATQRRLSPAGERQADSLGRALRALGVPVAEVVASPMDRARRTAELAFGRPRLDSAWHTRGEDFSGWKATARAAALAAPVPRGDRVIVSHLGTLGSALPVVRDGLEEGDCVVVRPRGETRYDVVGVVPWRAWLEAARQ